MFARTIGIAALAGTTVLLVGAAYAEVSIIYPEGRANLIEPAIEAYEAATGETVVRTKMPGNIDQRVTVDLAGGAATDVIYFDTYRTPEYAESGFLASLNGYVDGWDVWPTYYDSIKDMSSVDGEVLGIQVDTDVRMLWYNKAHFAAAGIETPWMPDTWDDVLEAAKAVQAASPDVEYPFYFPVGTKYGEATTMQGFYMALLGADTPEGDRNRLRDRADGKWIVDSPAIRRTLQFYQDVFVNENVSARDLYYTPDIWGDMRRAFVAGNVGILSGGSWEFNNFWRDSAGGVPSADERNEFLGWAPFPGSGDPGSPASSNVSGGWALAINEDAEDKDAAWGLIQAIMAPDNYTAWAAENGKLTPRGDTAASEVYMADAYLASIAPLVADTTSRDTFPGYSTVSSFIQEATEAVISGTPIDDVVAEYRANMIDEFGEDAVKTLD